MYQYTLAIDVTLSFSSISKCLVFFNKQFSMGGNCIAKSINLFRILSLHDESGTEVNFKLFLFLASSSISFNSTFGLN